MVQNKNRSYSVWTLIFPEKIFVFPFLPPEFIFYLSDILFSAANK